MDFKQARPSLAQTEAVMPPLVIAMRQANDRLCVLLGQPVEELLLGGAEPALPVASPEATGGGRAHTRYASCVARGSGWRAGRTARAPPGRSPGAARRSIAKRPGRRGGG